MKRRPPIAPGLALCLALLPAAGLAEPPGFDAWLTEFRQEAAQRGLSPEFLERSLAGLAPLPQVLERDRRQPEFYQTFLDYQARLVNEQRVAEGQARLLELKDLLAWVEARHGVPGRFLVAFWGVETNFGRNRGDFPTVAALATLAHDGRRGEFFRNELHQALRILADGHVAPQDLLGSWAGAQGQMQFMPSTFAQYAVDADGDGRKDIWNNLPDAFASAAHFLARLGWRRDETWGREILLPPGFDSRLAHRDYRQPQATWAAMGITDVDGQPLPASQQPAAVLLPQGRDGPAFLVYDNFRAILGWNRSDHYALAVGLLADRLLGLPGLRRGFEADNRRLSREQAIALQRCLMARGYDTGGADGLLGRLTREAIRAYQAQAGLPVDGYPSMGLLERLRQAEPSCPPDTGNDTLQAGALGMPCPAGDPCRAGAPRPQG